MKSIPIEDMSIERLRIEIISLRNGIDFIMDRVNDVVTENKKLKEQVEDGKVANDVKWVSLRKRNEEVRDLEEELVELKQLRDKNHNLSCGMMALDNQIDALQRGRKKSAIELEELYDKYEAKFAKIDEELSCKTKRILNQQDTIIGLQNDIVSFTKLITAYRRSNTKIRVLLDELE